MNKTLKPDEPDRPIASLTSRLLVHGYNTQAELVVSREFDFTQLPGDVPQEAELFARVIRRLKIMSGMNPWAEGEMETGTIDIGLGDQHLRYEIAFHNAKGNERAIVATPTYLGSYTAAREAGLLYRRPKPKEI